MKKIILLFVFYFLVSNLTQAQSYQVHISGISGGKYYSSTGWVTVREIPREPSWKWDVEEKISKKKFNLQITDSTVSFLDKTYRYKRKDHYPSPFSKGATHYYGPQISLFKQGNTVIVSSENKSQLYLLR